MDASFLHIEGPNNPMHIGGVSIFEGPAPPFERLEEMVAGKLDLVPRYRQKVRFVPLGARPAGLGGRSALQPRIPPAPHAPCRRRAATRCCAGPPRGSSPSTSTGDKPLWEIWMVEGLERQPLGAAVEGPSLHGRRRVGDRPDDGDVRRAAAPQAAPHGWEPGARAEWRRARRCARSSHQAASPSEQLRACGRLTRRPRATLAQAGTLLRGDEPRRPGCCARSARRRSPGRSARTGPGAPRTCT